MPSVWKDSFNSVIFVGGDNSEVSNSIARLFDKTSDNNLILLTNDIISRLQHLFVPVRSTITNVLILTHDNKAQMDSIFLDFYKAFDKVHHKTILFKVRNSRLTYRFSIMIH